MYKVSIPVRSREILSDSEREYLVNEFRRCGAERIFLTTAFSPNENLIARRLNALKSNIAFFDSVGIETAVWIGTSLGHGSQLLSGSGADREDWDKYVPMVGNLNKQFVGTLCPSSEPFVTDYSKFVADVASIGAKMIMFDDDFRLHHRPSIGAGCCCEMHMAEYAKRVGREVKLEEIEELIYKGKPNNYRREWFKLQKESLVGLAENIRRAVDKVNPDARLGLCISGDNWDQGGNIALDIAKAFAGKNKPFIRTNAAPYWVPFHNTRLNYLIELTRQQAFWCKDEDIEIFSEGDAYPRPKYTTSASLMEMFDMALRADGNLDGILKYMIDYVAPAIESGYVDAMVHHKNEYEWIEKNLAPFDALGVDIINPAGKSINADLHETLYVRYINDNYFHSAGARMLVDSSIPTSYGTDSVHIACGECARYVTEKQLKEGLVTDVRGALILQEMGIDTGIVNASEPMTKGGNEIFEGMYGKIGIMSFSRFRSLELKPECIVDSSIDGMPVCYRFENKDGVRFTVYAFEVGDSVNGYGTLRSYNRQKQLISNLEWTGKKKLPCVCTGNPDLYIIAKQTEKGMNIGLFNLSEDYIYSPELTLDKEYFSVKAFNCTATADKNNLKVAETIPPYYFVGIELSK